MTDKVVIVGAGHNGLVAACYLAKAGLKPLVLERRGVVGGAAVTEEFHEGFRCSTLAHAAGPLVPQVVRELGLERHGEFHEGFRCSTLAHAAGPLVPQVV